MSIRQSVSWRGGIASGLTAAFDPFRIRTWPAGAISQNLTNIGKTQSFGPPRSGNAHGVFVRLALLGAILLGLVALVLAVRISSKSSKLSLMLIGISITLNVAAFATALANGIVMAPDSSKHSD